jgi:hypothetical protein
MDEGAIRGIVAFIASVTAFALLCGLAYLVIRTLRLTFSHASMLRAGVVTFVLGVVLSGAPGLLAELERNAPPFSVEPRRAERSTAQYDAIIVGTGIAYFVLALIGYLAWNHPGVAPKERRPVTRRRLPPPPPHPGVPDGGGAP